MVAMRCAAGFVLEHTEHKKVCRRAGADGLPDGSGHWKCGRGFQPSEAPPYCVRSARRQPRRRHRSEQSSVSREVVSATLLLGDVRAHTRPDFVCVNP